MGASRLLTPVPGVLPGLRVTSYTTSTAVPVGISRDRKTIYGTPAPGVSTSTTLYQSVDDGTTWTSVHVFAEAVQGCLETDDGEILVATITVAGTPSYVYKSSGWASSHTAATWTKTLTTAGGFIRPVWGLHNASFGNDLIAAGTGKFGVVSEYGAQTAGIADQTKPIHVYSTNDYGATWTAILDLQARYGTSLQPIHVHASAYDPYWDRIWVTYGDTPGDGTSNTQILYSDDRGATWNAVPLSSEWATYDQLQSISILPLENVVLFSSDNKPGVLSIARDGYRVVGAAQIRGPVLNGVSTSGLIGMALYRNRNQPGAPIFASYQNVSASVSRCPILVSLDGGDSFTEAWRDTAILSSGGVFGVFGPTYSGKVVAYELDANGTTRNLLRGELVIPDPNLFDGVTTITGDAVTTVFTVAHGLSAKPNQVVTWPTSKTAATASVTVTSDATNLTFTFGSAPASAAVLDYAYRIGL